MKLTKKEMLTKVLETLQAESKKEVVLVSTENEDGEVVFESVDKTDEQKELETEMVNGILHEIELLQRGSKKMTKAQEENEALKNKILEFLSDCKHRTVSTVLASGKFSNYSSQKLSALMNQLVREGLLCKESENRVTLFFINEEIIATDEEIVEEEIFATEEEEVDSYDEFAEDTEVVVAEEEEIIIEEDVEEQTEQEDSVEEDSVEEDVEEDSVEEVEESKED